MSEKPIWQRTTTERAAAFANAFSGIAPGERKEPSLQQQLNTIRPLILRKRNEGYTVDQIRAALKHPDIAIDASVASIRRMIVAAERKLEQRRKARIAALTPKPAIGATKSPKPAAPGVAAFAQA